MGRRARSSSSSSIESSSKSNPYGVSTSRNLSTDLRLGLSFGSGSGSGYTAAAGGRRRGPPVEEEVDQEEEYMEVEGEEEENECNSVGSFYVKVNMEGVPIGRKIDLFALHGYHDLIRTLDLMFNTAILWADEEEMYHEKTHVLTYADKEGDWMMVGDVPWEMFLSSVRRLKITRAYNY